MKLFTALLILFSLPLLAVSGHMEGYVPVVAHAPGAMNSFWTSDVWIYQQGAGTIHVWYNPMGQDNTANESVVIPLEETVTVLHDIVSETFLMEGAGSLHYIADGPVVVTTRTWTPDPDGGRYGQTIPGIPSSEASYMGTGQAGTHRMVVDKMPGTRANLGIVNIAPNLVTARVEIFAADGSEAPGETQFTVDLQPFDSAQIGDVLSRVEGTRQEGLVVRVGVLDGDAAVMAYLSVVDNETNDASYLEGFRFGY